MAGKPAATRCLTEGTGIVTGGSPAEETVTGIVTEKIPAEETATGIVTEEIPAEETAAGIVTDGNPAEESARTDRMIAAARSAPPAAVHRTRERAVMCPA